MNILAGIVAIILFIGGMLLFGYAELFPAYEALVFAGGIVAVSLSVAIPVHILKRIDG